MQWKLQCVTAVAERSKLLIVHTESRLQSPCAKIIMPEISTGRDYERLGESQSAEEEAYSSSGLTSETASIFSLHKFYLSEDRQKEGNSSQTTERCVIDNRNAVSPRVLPISDFTPLSRNARKRQVEAFKELPAFGVMRNGRLRYRVSSRVPKCPSKSGSKQQHVINKSFNMEKEVSGDSDLSMEQMPCHNGDLCSECSENLRKPHKCKDVSVCDGGNHCCTLDYREPSRKEFGSDYDAIAVKQEGGLSSSLPTHLLAWLAGLVIHTLRFQWNLLFNMIFSVMLAWYHSFLFALHPLSYILRARAKATEAYRRKKNNTQNLGCKLQGRALVMRPALAIGARKLAFGSLTALYTLSILTCLFVASLMLSFSVMKGFVHEPVHLNEYLFFDYTKQFPIASLDFTDSMMYSHGGSLFGRVSCPTRNFRATVYLTVPESDFNKELGIFQVTAELISTTGQVLLSKTQPCMLQFRSTTVQHVKAFLMALPLLAGSYFETQTLVASPLKWQEQRALSLAALRVVLAPRAGRPSFAGVPELYEAGVRLESELPWWARFIGSWRWTLSVWLGLALFIGVVVIMLGLCNHFLLPDLGLVLSFVSKGLVKGESFKVKEAYH